MLNDCGLKMYAQMKFSDLTFLFLITNPRLHLSYSNHNFSTCFSRSAPEREVSHAKSGDESIKFP